MNKYESRQVQINKPDFLIFQSLSNFSNFTPMLADKVEQWQATEDSCSFKVKGFTLKLVMVNKEENKLIKVTGDNMPFEFYFWIQLHRVDEYDTRMKLTVHAKLNMMMKMMLGKKLEKGIDEMAEQIAAAFNKI